MRVEDDGVRADAPQRRTVDRRIDSRSPAASRRAAGGHHGPPRPVSPRGCRARGRTGRGRRSRGRAARRVSRSSAQLQPGQAPCIQPPRIPGHRPRRSPPGPDAPLLDVEAKALELLPPPGVGPLPVDLPRNPDEASDWSASRNVELVQVETERLSATISSGSRISDLLRVPHRASSRAGRWRAPRPFRSTIAARGAGAGTVKSCSPCADAVRATEHCAGLQPDRPRPKRPHEGERRTGPEGA